MAQLLNGGMSLGRDRKEWSNLIAGVCHQSTRGFLLGVAAAAICCSSRSCQTLMWVPSTLHDCRKVRPFSRIGTVAFLGLALCVFAWGLAYKLSLYNPPQAPSHPIPHAKLLSKNEQSGRTERPLIVRSKTSTRTIFTALVVVSFFLLPVLGRVNPPPSAVREDRANRSWLLRCRAFPSSLFVRPPPVLA